MDASLIFIAILAMWLLGLFPHLVRRRTQIVDASRVDRLPDTVRIVGSESHDRIGGTRSTAAILSTAAARTAANKQFLDVKAMDGNTVGTSGTNPTSVRPARPTRPVRWESATSSTAAAPSSPAAPDAAVRAQAKATKIRIRRLGVGFVGLAAITLVSAALAVFSVVSWGIPLAGLVLAVVDLFVLRAVHASSRAAKARPEANPADESRAHVATEPATTAAKPRTAAARGSVRRVASSREADRQTDHATKAKTQRSVSMAQAAFPATAQAEAARNDNSNAAADDVPTQQIRAGLGDAPRRPAAPSKGSVSWSPVPVPRPTYLDAPKAERAEPAPLVVDASVHDKVERPAAEEEAAQDLSRSEAKESAARQWVEEPGHRPEVEDARPLTVNKTAAQVGRLDDVLQRRRAVGE